MISGADSKAKLPPPIEYALEEMIPYMQPDEMVEVTPSVLRLRKQVCVCVCVFVVPAHERAVFWCVVCVCVCVCVCVPLPPLPLVLSRAHSLTSLHFSSTWIAMNARR